MRITIMKWVRMRITIMKWVRMSITIIPSFCSSGREGTLPCTLETCTWYVVKIMGILYAIRHPATQAWPRHASITPVRLCLYGILSNQVSIRFVTLVLRLGGTGISWKVIYFLTPLSERVTKHRTQLGKFRMLWIQGEGHFNSLGGSFTLPISKFHPSVLTYSWV